jgi:hypothetical protein
MKPILAMTLAGAFAIAGLSLAPAQAIQTSHDHSEFSSANKRSKHVRHYNGRRYGGNYGPAYRRSYAADPSFSPSGRPYRPSVYSPCTIDLGYGRFTSCDR